MNCRLAIPCLLAVLAFASHDACAAQLTQQEAIAKVERENKGKVLKVETKQLGKKTIYRIKVLTHDGEVKVIEVPADG